MVLLYWSQAVFLSAVKTRKYVLLLQLPQSCLSPSSAFSIAHLASPFCLCKNICSLCCSVPTSSSWRLAGQIFNFFSTTPPVHWQGFCLHPPLPFIPGLTDQKILFFFLSVFPPEPYVAMPVSWTSPKNLDFRSNDCRFAGVSSSLVMPLPLLSSPFNWTISLPNPLPFSLSSFLFDLGVLRESLLVQLCLSFSPLLLSSPAQLDLGTCFLQLVISNGCVYPVWPIAGVEECDLYGCFSNSICTSAWRERYVEKE